MTERRILQKSQWCFLGLLEKVKSGRVPLFSLGFSPRLVMVGRIITQMVTGGRGLAVLVVERRATCHF